MRKYGVELPRRERDYSKYNSKEDPSITNSFATAAYRYQCHIMVMLS